MRKALSAVLLAIFLLTAFAFPAWAEVYRGASLDNLRSETYEGKVVLTWDVDVRKDVGVAYGDTKVTIRKSRDNYGLNEAEVVKTLPLTQAGTVRMTWTDHDVSPGETLYYRVETGSVSWRFKSVSVTVSAAPREEPRTPGEPTGLDERRRAYA